MKIKKYFRITIGISILMLLLTGIGAANIPPPPVNQSLGAYDTYVDKLTEQNCRVCHTGGTSDRHNTTGYNCDDCHPIINGESLIDKNCLNCHNGSAFYANPNLIIDRPHHNTTNARQRDCKVCHETFVDNYDDGHYIPTSILSINSIVCKTCHEQDSSALPPIFSNDMTHHVAIVIPIQRTIPTCIWCHPNAEDVMNIRGCEQCHSVQSLHDIQYNYSETNGLSGYGHIGSNWDCKGCHVNSNHGVDCKLCHSYPIIIPSHTSRILGTKFNDLDSNGIRNAGESGESGVRIILRRIISPGNEIDYDSVLTDTNGDYTFINLSAGSYEVREITPSDASQTFPESGAPYYINIGIDEVKSGIDFGNHHAPPGNISGNIFNDSNGNGVQDAGENGISGIKIILASTGISATTNSNGDYIFNNVPVGMQIVYEDLMSGYMTTTPRFVNVQVNSGDTSIINFGSTKLKPPPSDVSILQQFGNQNDIPTVNRPGLTTLVIRKNLSSINNVLRVNLTLKWGNDGTIKTAEMVQIGTTGVWEAIISSPFPSGYAHMTFNADVAPAGSGGEDIIQIGDIIFLDPSGQILSACKNEPISGANVTLYVEFPPTTGNFIKSPSGYQLEPNPQTTSADGYYGWMTIPGTYKVNVTMAGYISNESEPVIVPPPRTGLDIILKSVNGCPYNFTGFLPPVENPPVLNKVKAGSAIPIKFSLDGYRGMNIFDTGYPKSSVISCQGPIDTIGDNETITTGESGLSYNKTTDQYKYVWKTDKKWTDCRQLVVKLNDGTYHRTNFGFFK